MASAGTANEARRPGDQRVKPIVTARVWRETENPDPERRERFPRV